MSAPPSGPLACFGIVHAESSEQRDAALATLAGLLASGEEDEPFQQLCKLIRSTEGCLEHVCTSLEANASGGAKQSALVILGNLFADGTDADRQRIRGLGALDRALGLLGSTDPELLRCAAGACMNFCHGIEEASRICELGLVDRLIELGASSDPIVAELSAGAVHNVQVCMARESLTRISVEKYEEAAATAIQAIVCGFIARQRTRAKMRREEKRHSATTEAGGTAKDEPGAGAVRGGDAGEVVGGGGSAGGGSLGIEPSEEEEPKAVPLPRALRKSLRRTSREFTAGDEPSGGGRSRRVSREFAGGAEPPQELALLHSAATAAANARATEQAALQAASDAALRVWMRGQLWQAFDLWMLFHEDRLIARDVAARCGAAAADYELWCMVKTWGRWAPLVVMSVAGRWFRRWGSRLAFFSWQEHAEECRTAKQIDTRVAEHRLSHRKEARSWAAWADAACAQPQKRMARAHHQRHELRMLRERAQELSALRAMMASSRAHRVRKVAEHIRCALGVWQQAILAERGWAERDASTTQAIQLARNVRRLADAWRAISLYAEAVREEHRRETARKAEEEEEERQRAVQAAETMAAEAAAAEAAAAAAAEAAAAEAAAAEAAATKAAEKAAAEKAAVQAAVEAATAQVVEVEMQAAMEAVSAEAAAAREAVAKAAAAAKLVADMDAAAVDAARAVAEGASLSKETESNEAEPLEATDLSSLATTSEPEAALESTERAGPIESVIEAELQTYAAPAASAAEPTTAAPVDVSESQQSETKDEANAMSSADAADAAEGAAASAVDETLAQPEAAQESTAVAAGKESTAIAAEAPIPSVGPAPDTPPVVIEEPAPGSAAEKPPNAAAETAAASDAVSPAAATQPAAPPAAEPEAPTEPKPTGVAAEPPAPAPLVAPTEPSAVELTPSEPVVVASAVEPDPHDEIEEISIAVPQAEGKSAKLQETETEAEDEQARPHETETAAEQASNSAGIAPQPRPDEGPMLMAPDDVPSIALFAGRDPRSIPLAEPVSTTDDTSSTHPRETDLLDVEAAVNVSTEARSDVDGASTPTAMNESGKDAIRQALVADEHVELEVVVIVESRPQLEDKSTEQEGEGENLVKRAAKDTAGKASENVTADAKLEADAKVKGDEKVAPDAKALADMKAEADAKAAAEAKALDDAKATAEAKALADTKVQADKKAKANAQAAAEEKGATDAKARSDRKAPKKSLAAKKVEADAKALADAKASRAYAEAEVERFVTHPSSPSYGQPATRLPSPPTVAAPPTSATKEAEEAARLAAEARTAIERMISLEESRKPFEEEVEATRQAVRQQAAEQAAERATAENMRKSDQRNGEEMAGDEFAKLQEQLDAVRRKEAPTRLQRDELRGNPSSPGCEKNPAQLLHLPEISSPRRNEPRSLPPTPPPLSSIPPISPRPLSGTPRPSQPYFDKWYAAELANPFELAEASEVQSEEARQNERVGREEIIHELYGKHATAISSRVGGVGSTRVPSDTYYIRNTRPLQTLARPGTGNSMSPRQGARRRHSSEDVDLLKHRMSSNDPAAGVRPARRHSSEAADITLQRQNGEPTDTSFGRRLSNDNITARRRRLSADEAGVEGLRDRVRNEKTRHRRHSTGDANAVRRRPALWEQAAPKGWVLEREGTDGHYVARTEHVPQPPKTPKRSSYEQGLHGRLPPRQSRPNSLVPAAAPQRPGTLPYMNVREELEWGALSVRE